MSEELSWKVETRLEWEDFVVYSPEPQNRPFVNFRALFEAAVEKAPSRTLLIQRSENETREITYADALMRATNIARMLIHKGVSQDRPLAILSENSIEHALLSMGALIAGVPVSPVSVAYSQLSDKSRLLHILKVLNPGFVYAETESDFADSLKCAKDLGLVTVTSSDTPFVADSNLADLVVHTPVTSFELPQVSPDDVAKILFTSGSTGAPKGVITTHRMICSNQEALREVWPFLKDEPPVIVDWLPWNHTYGGNLVFCCAVRNSGTFVIDNGRPAPGTFSSTIKNLMEYGPTVYFGVPRGYDLLVKALEENEEFARQFFRRLRVSFSAGAALPLTVWEKFRAVAAKYGRQDFCSHIGWGATETSPLASITPPGNTRADNIGVPIPGAELKMVNNEDKLELRVRGPMVTPGYWKQEATTRDAFDEDGFYCIGDAGKLIDQSNPSLGILFDGRTAENFKLVTGTWVQVGALRMAAIEAGAGLIQDAVVTGHDRDEVGLMIFLDLFQARKISGKLEAELPELVTDVSVHTAIAGILQKLDRGRSSSRIARAILLAEPPSVEGGEMTDKGYINQRAVLRHREADVVKLYANPPGGDIIRPEAHS